MNHATNWWPGLIVLLGGAVAALAYFLIAQRRAPKVPSPGASAAVDDLEQRSARALEQLKELEAERHHYSEEQYAAEKARLERAAADALRLEDAARRKAPAPRGREAATSAGFWGRNPRLKGALWGGGVVGFFLLVGWVLRREQAPRTEEGSMTGRTPPGGAAPQAEDPVMAAAIKRLEANPDNVPVMNEVVHQLIRREAFQEATRYTDRAVGLDPFSVEARIHRSIVRAITTGDMPGTRTELEHLARTYPGTYEANLYAGAIAMKSGDKAAALHHFERYVAEAPKAEQPPMIAQSVSALRQELGSAKAP